MKRKGISPKLRFEVFHRDNFTCQYCGLSVPDVALELDHIEPVSKGGTNDNDNLITSCTCCNRGKSAKKMVAPPISLKDKTKALKEKQKQLKAYHAELEKKLAAENKLVDILENEFVSRYENNGKFAFTERFRSSIRNNFIPRLDIDVLKNAIYTATDKCKFPEQATAYFCGICWNKIKGRDSF